MLISFSTANMQSAISVQMASLQKLVISPIDRRLSLQKLANGRLPIADYFFFFFFCPIAVHTPAVGDGRRTIGTTNMFL
jgi:hypothetical protein